jgi:DNA-binding NtrC family response regulator
MKESLVVSDDSEVREKLNNALASLGFEVFQTSSVKKALKLLKEHQNVSIVVTDRVFDQKEGEWLIHSMQKDSRLSAIPVIVLGEYSGIKSIFNLLKIGASAFIPKPFLDKYFKDYVCRYSRG